MLEKNVPIVRLMLACQTQWRVSFAGATGLDYNALFLVAGALGVEVNESVLAGIRTLEDVTLEYWAAKEKNKAKE